MKKISLMRLLHNLNLNHIHHLNHLHNQLVAGHPQAVMILANKLSLEVHAGHGLDYKTTKILSKINEIQEFNIGHFIIGESIFFGLAKIIRNFKKIIKH